MKIQKAEVINNPIANTTWGKRRVLNCKLLPSKEKVACWSNDLNNPIYLSKKPGDIVELIADEKGKYSVLDREADTGENTATSQHPIIPPQYAHSKAVNDYEDILDGDLPMLSNSDKKKLAGYITQQTDLFYYIMKEVEKKFPDLILSDPRAIRSIALSLFIDIQRKIG